MQRKKFILICVLLLTGFFYSLCQAAIVVDTGPGPSSGDPWFLDSIHNGMAGKFTTTRTYNITSAEAWMQVDAGGRQLQSFIETTAAARSREPGCFPKAL